jgi:uncharacterized protein DUF6817
VAERSQKHILIIRDPLVAVVIRKLSRASRLQHSQRSFRAHLIGTWRILTDWGVSKTVCRAGLLHSAYSTSFYPHALYRVTHRPFVRQLIGHRAEALVYRFCAISRRELWARVHDRSCQEALTVPNRFNTSLRIKLRAVDVRNLAIVESANIAEQSRAADGGPAPWMSQVFGLWRLLTPEEIPVRFEVRPLLTTESERHAIAMYRRALTHAPAESARWLDRAIASNPWAAEPRILRAIQATTMEDHQRAALEISGAEKLLSKWAVPWDKRISVATWQDLIRHLGSTNRRVNGHITLPFIRSVLERSTSIPAWLVE